MRTYTFQSSQDWVFTTIVVQISESRSRFSRVLSQSRAGPSGVGIASHH